LGLSGMIFVFVFHVRLLFTGRCMLVVGMIVCARYLSYQRCLADFQIGKMAYITKMTVWLPLTVIGQ